MNYVELSIECSEELSDILVAELADYPFDSGSKRSEAS